MLDDTIQEILEMCLPHPSAYILTQPGKSAIQLASALLPCSCPALPVFQTMKIKL